VRRPPEPVRIGCLSVVMAVVVATAGDGPAAGPRLPADDPAVTRWEADVAALEARDATEPDPPGAILLLGSSSIRRWDTSAEDLAPWAVVRRGYGGARYRDLAHFVTRLVAAHECRAIVVFVANDITPQEPATIAEVMHDVRVVHDRIRRRHPEVPLLFVAVTPTPSRWAAWPEITRLNDALAEFAAAAPATSFVATADRFLDEGSGLPIASFFHEDRLHLSREGYRTWGELIGAALDDMLAEVPAETPAAR
jgi:lysophospholipase L1-like esterase